VGTETPAYETLKSEQKLQNGMKPFARPYVINRLRQEIQDGIASGEFARKLEETKKAIESGEFAKELEKFEAIYASTNSDQQNPFSLPVITEFFGLLEKRNVELSSNPEDVSEDESERETSIVTSFLASVLSFVLYSHQKRAPLPLNESLLPETAEVNQLLQEQFCATVITPNDARDILKAFAENCLAKGVSIVLPYGTTLVIGENRTSYILTKAEEI